MKWYWKLLIVVIILALGGALYDTISSHRSVNRLNSTVESFRERNVELIGKLTDAQGRIVEIEGELAEIKRTSERLGDSLRRSQEKLTGLRKQFDNLRAENQRLTAILDRSTDSAAGIRAESGIIAGSLDNALDIVGRLEEVYTEK